MKTLENLSVQVNQLLATRQGYRTRALEALAELEELTTYLNDSLMAQQIISSVSDERTEKLIAYITGVLNKALQEIFPKSHKTIRLQRKLYRDIYPHINVVVEDENGESVDLTLAMGAGIGVVVSFLYRICLIEVNGDRKLLITDEILHGIHRDAVVVLKEIIKLFANEGFQFVMVEYALDTVDLGKYYNVHRVGDHSEVTASSWLEVQYNRLITELTNSKAPKSAFTFAERYYKEQNVVITAREALNGTLDTAPKPTEEFPTNQEINFDDQLTNTQGTAYEGAIFTAE